MRVIECHCGDVVQAANDEDLIKELRRHIDSEHPGSQSSDEELSALIQRKAYDAGDS